MSDVVSPEREELSEQERVPKDEKLNDKYEQIELPIEKTEEKIIMKLGSVYAEVKVDDAETKASRPPKQPQSLVKDNSGPRSVPKTLGVATKVKPIQSDTGDALFSYR